MRNGQGREIKNKQEILAYFIENGERKTVDKFKVCVSTLYRWKKEATPIKSPAPPQTVRVGRPTGKNTDTPANEIEMRYLRETNKWLVEKLITAWRNEARAE